MKRAELSKLTVGDTFAPCELVIDTGYVREDTPVVVRLPDGEYYKIVAVKMIMVDRKPIFVVEAR